MIVAYVHFLNEALIGWQDQVYIHINTIKEGSRVATGESYRGKNGTEGAKGFVGRLYPGASSSVHPEATAPLLCVFPMCCLFIPLCQHSSPVRLCAALIAIQMIQALDPI